MKYYSTKNKNYLVSLKEAVLKGLPQDNGLYMPQEIPSLPESFFKNLPSLNIQEIGKEVSRAFFKGDLSASDINWIVEDSITFDAPLKHIQNSIYALELFHGPTMAFKDFGARFMSRIVSKLQEKQDKTVHILVATSGDTGSAVAQGFYDVEGIHVTILYPSGKVSKIQEQQIATLDKNITTLEVDGTFDDCQHLVKTAFLDKELNRKIVLSSANSINIARLIPQSFYYFHAYGQSKKQNNNPLVMCVPSGNFGNLTAGLIANKMGLKIHKFIAAVNANNTFPTYLKTGKFTPKPSVKTLSNAMDVGNPSNLDRIFDLFNNDVEMVRTKTVSDSYNDEQTKQTMREVFKESGYILDPHGAVAYTAMKEYKKRNIQSLIGIIFETASPAKFKDTVDDVLSIKVKIPEQLLKFMKREKTAISISKEYESFKEYLVALK